MRSSRAVLRWACTLLFAGVCGQAAAAAATASPPADRLKSPACLQALHELDGAVAAAASASASKPSAAIENKRRSAAVACLGGWVASPTGAARGLQSPISVAPVARQGPSPAHPLVPATPTRVPGASPAPLYILSCDRGGCTASDGSRLPRVGSGVLGPQGVCSVQGSVLNCP